MEIRPSSNQNISFTNTPKSNSTTNKSIDSDKQSDKFTPSAKEDPPLKASPKDSMKAYGTVGAAIGSAIGKTALPALGIVAGVLSASVLGPIGAGIAIAGLGAGFFAEKKLRAGNIAVGMAGGVIGSAAGKIAEKMNIAPSDKLAETTKNFSFKSLYSKLKTRGSTSMPKITLEQAQEFKKLLKPGDIIVGNNDTDMNFEIAQKLLGTSGNWTHACIVKDENTVMETLIPEVTDRHLSDESSASKNRAGGFEENKIEDMIMRNHHLMILRPQYKDDETIQNVIEVGNSFKNVQYDMRFNLSSDDKMYCTEFVYKVLQKAAPEIKIDPGKFMGIKFVTADHIMASKDIDLITTTGSDFWTNYLSHYS